jgi:propionate CoA-transferase
MDLKTKLDLLARMARWRLTWDRRDLDYVPPGVRSARFLSARQTAALIPDGAVVFSSGMAGNHRNSIFFWAVRDRFVRHGTPRGLLWITVGAQGGRGQVPGTIEELDRPGLLRCYLGGHVETAKALLCLADADQLELHVMPQGVQTFILEAMARGAGDWVTSDTGVGTFLDPRVGPGTAVLPGARESFVTVDDGRLRYRLPPIDVSLFVAPAADADGNVYMRGACMLTETREATLATKRRGGKVLVSVAEIIERDEPAIAFPRDLVDTIVVNPFTEQLAGARQLEPMEFCMVGAKVDPVEVGERLRFVNDVVRITPQRGAVDKALARLAADRFTRVARPGATVNVGVGHPEEVSRVLFETGLSRDLTFTSETGVYGGLPAPGIFFGAAINPERFLSSAEMFHLYEDRLAVALFGMLEADGDGNVNVSRRGPRAIDCVGPGGLPDIAAAARTIVFVGSWMAAAKLEIRDGRLVIRRGGRPKFVRRVGEITFNGREALRRGKRVYYVTNVGVFQLTAGGMELVEVMPGLDIARDVVAGSPMPVVVRGAVPVVAPGIVTGQGFTLRWKDTADPADHGDAGGGPPAPARGLPRGPALG